MLLIADALQWSSYVGPALKFLASLIPVIVTAFVAIWTIRAQNRRSIEALREQEKQSKRQVRATTIAAIRRDELNKLRDHLTALLANSEEMIFINDPIKKLRIRNEVKRDEWYVRFMLSEDVETASKLHESINEFDSMTQEFNVNACSDEEMSEFIDKSLKHRWYIFELFQEYYDRELKLIQQDIA